MQRVGKLDRWNPTIFQISIKLHPRSFKFSLSIGTQSILPQESNVRNVEAWIVSRNLGGGGGNFEILLAFCAPRKWIKLEARRAGARNWSAIDKERGVEPLDEKLYPEEKRPRIRRVWPEWIYMYIRSSLLARTTAWRDTLGCCFTFNSNTFLIRRACCVKKRKFRSKKLDCLNRRRGEEGDVEGIKWLKDWDEGW